METKLSLRRLADSLPLSGVYKSLEVKGMEVLFCSKYRSTRKVCVYHLLIKTNEFSLSLSIFSFITHNLFLVIVIVIRDLASTRADSAECDVVIFSLSFFRKLSREKTFNWT